MPPHCSRDVEILLELQKKKLDDSGLRVVEELKFRPAFEQPFHGEKQAGAFRTDLQFEDYHRRVRYITLSGRTLYSTSRNITTMTNVADIMGKHVPPKTPIRCPYCGAVSRAQELVNGCSYCGTHFKARELYPVTTGWHYTADYSMRKNEFAGEILPFVLAGVFLFGGLGVYNILTGGDPFNIIGWAIGGAMAGYVTWALSKVLYVFSGLRVLFTGVLRCLGSDKKLNRFFEPIDPNYSYRHFEDKLISLFKMMAYAENAAELPIWCGEGAPDRTDIIDSEYLGIVLKGINTDAQGYCDITFELLAYDLHFKRGRIRRRKDNYLMRIRKNIKRPTRLGFSLSAVICPKCGGSFDAYREKQCPFCGDRYRVENDDWTVTAFRKL